jgi:hypothetical protein
MCGHNLPIDIIRFRIPNNLEFTPDSSLPSRNGVILFNPPKAFYRKFLVTIQVTRSVTITVKSFLKK